MTKELTKEKSEKIKIEVKEHILRAEKIKQKDMKLIEQFRTKFTICESAYKIMEQRIGNLKERKNIRLNLRRIKPNIIKLNYDINEELLDKLFGSNGKRGSKSIKKLRDALTHDVNQKDIDEVKERETELFNIMDIFLSKLKNFDV